MATALPHALLKPLSKSRVLITGATSGIGYEMCKQLLVQGAEVVMVGRTEKATSSVQSLQTYMNSSYPNTAPVNIRYLPCNLSSLNSVQELIEQIKSILPIDYYIFNAGIAYIPYTLTDDNLEAQFQVNYLSNAYITLSLILLLSTQTTDSTLYFVSSEILKYGELNINNVQGELSYSRFKFYAHSKFYLTSFCHFLATSVIPNMGITNVHLISLHPGMVETGLHRNCEDLKWVGVANKIRSLFGLRITPTQSATNILKLASSHEIILNNPGAYFEHGKVVTPKVSCYTPATQMQLFYYTLTLLRDRVETAIYDKYVLLSSEDKLHIADAINQRTDRRANTT